MKRLGLSIGALSILIAATATGGQQHAPTVDQCRADTAAWSHDDIAKIPVVQVRARLTETGNCITVDASRKDWYQIVEGLYASELGSRMYDFLQRHNLVGQFIDEDEQGLR
jgi:hypothetical protein